MYKAKFWDYAIIGMMVGLIAIAIVVASGMALFPTVIESGIQDGGFMTRLFVYTSALGGMLLKVFAEDEVNDILNS